MARLWAVWVLLIILGAVAVVTGDSVWAHVFWAVGLTAAEVALLSRLAGGFTAPLIPVLLVNGIMTVGYVGWETVRHQAAVSARLAVTQEQLASSLAVALLLTAGITAGAALGGAKATTLQSSAGLSVSTGYLVITGYLIIGLAILGRGEAILRAPAYLDYAGPTWAISMAGALTPAAALTLSFAVFQPGHRMAALIGLVILALNLFGASTRQLALLPGALVLGKALASGGHIRRRLPIATLAAAAVATLVLAQLAITLRSTPGGVGIMVFAERISQNPLLILNELDPARVLGNILFSAPQTARVSEVAIARDWFWTSISPVAGGSTDWPTIAPRLRFNEYTPFNGLGELATQGHAFVILYGVVAGAALARCTAWVKAMSGMFQSVGTLAVLALSTLFSVTLLQYNLRTASRLVWYALGLTAALWVVNKMLQSANRAKVGAGLERSSGGSTSDDGGITRSRGWVPTPLANSELGPQA